MSLSFVKDEDTYGEKMARKVLEQLFKSNIHFRSVFIIPSNYIFHLSLAKNTELYLDNHHMTIPLL